MTLSVARLVTPLVPLFMYMYIVRRPRTCIFVHGSLNNTRSWHQDQTTNMLIPSQNIYDISVSVQELKVLIAFTNSSGMLKWGQWPDSRVTVAAAGPNWLAICCWIESGNALSAVQKMYLQGMPFVQGSKPDGSAKKRRDVCVISLAHLACSSEDKSLNATCGNAWASPSTRSSWIFKS